VIVGDTTGGEMGSCNPSASVLIPCFEATDDKTAAAATPTPGAVGGMAELPDIGGASREEAGAWGDGSGWSAGIYAVLAGIRALAATTIAAGAWYARRRWLR
jgi:hypothetical protein